MKRTRRKTGPDANTVGLVISRSGGLCERCLAVRGEQIHHRTPRMAGGTREPRINRCDNLVYLCHICHSWVEADRDQARRDGWLWPRHEFDREEARAVRLGSVLGSGLSGHLVLLTPDGQYEDLPPEA